MHADVGVKLRNSTECAELSSRGVPDRADSASAPMSINRVAVTISIIAPDTRISESSFRPEMLTSGPSRAGTSAEGAQMLDISSL